VTEGAYYEWLGLSGFPFQPEETTTSSQNPKYNRKESYGVVERGAYGA